MTPEVLAATLPPTTTSVRGSLRDAFEPDSWLQRLTRGAIARRLVAYLLARVPVLVRLSGGRVLGAGDPDGPVLEIHDEDAVFRRIESHPKIGLGEAYMAGEWAAAPGTDLADALTPFATRLEQVVPKPLLALRRVVDRALPVDDLNDPEGSRSNIAAHYDLSNELFALFLDPSMSYSAALFDESEAAVPWSQQDLTAAQHRKIDAVLDAAGVVAGTRLLEIGTGWGELAIRAAARGAHVTTITLSVEQRDLAIERIAAAGFAESVDVRLEDYREVVGTYDAIVSVEMIEAVGEEFWPRYFATIDARLAPGGTAIIQSILMSHDRYLTTRRSYGWIQKYIFPGGLLPSPEAIAEVTTRHTALRVVDTRSFGPHYAHTLRRWREAFTAATSKVERLGFDETFRRMWEFYLAYSEAGFASGYLDVAHLTLRREVNDRERG